MLIGEFFLMGKHEEKGVIISERTAIHEPINFFTHPFHTHEEHQTENIRGYFTSAPIITGIGDITHFEFDKFTTWD